MSERSRFCTRIGLSTGYGPRSKPGLFIRENIPESCIVISLVCCVSPPLESLSPAEVVSKSLSKTLEIRKKHRSLDVHLVKMDYCFVSEPSIGRYDHNPRFSRGCRAHGLRQSSVETHVNVILTEKEPLLRN